MRRFFGLFLMLVFIGTVCPQPARGARCQDDIARDHPPSYKRLILKDGSYELIGRYEVRGDRVRYFSSERHEWEELPFSMIDWAATEQYAARESREAAGLRHEALDRAAKERMEEEARAPLVAPGMRLPSPDGVFLLDEYRGRPALSKLAQNGADRQKNTGSNILRAVINPIAGSKQTVELRGRTSLIQSHVRNPSIYFAVDASDPLTAYSSETAKDHLRIVRCENRKDNRLVASISIAVYGQVKQKAKFVDAKVEPVSDYWVRVTPLAPLQNGEYALVELDEKGSINQFVWDFGVNPAAPPNPALEPSGPEKEEPVLIERPREKEKR
jgi:hypothetical protein